jgi:hypothetical protein
MAAIFTCKRCNYETIYKKSLIKHLEKQKECPVINQDIDRTLLIHELTCKNEQEYIYKCQNCNKVLKHKSSLSRHEANCSKKQQDKDNKHIKELESRIQNLEKKTLISYDKKIKHDVCTDTIYILHKLLPGGGFVGLCSLLQVLFGTNINVFMQIRYDGLIYTMVQREHENLNEEHLINALDDIEIQHTSSKSFKGEKPRELFELYKGKLDYKYF